MQSPISVSKPHRPGMQGLLGGFKHGARPAMAAGSASNVGWLLHCDGKVDGPKHCVTFGYRLVIVPVIVLPSFF